MQKEKLKLLPILVKYRPGMPKIEKHGVMYDLATSETVTIAKGQVKMIDLGVAMQLPKGHFARVYPRSSTFKKWHIMLANSVGIIDPEYCGDDDYWQFPAYAIETVTIPKGTRIAQFEIASDADQWYSFIVETAHLNNPNRGGFGTTGD